MQGAVLKGLQAAGATLSEWEHTVTSRHYGEWLNGKMGIDVNERREKAAAFHAFLKNECNETAFAATVKQLVEA